MEKVDVLLGLQWGDEGKGKVVDVLTPHYDLVARFQGGPNAGHTLEFDNKKYVLRSIPSGIFQGGKYNVIGNGVVLDPLLFREEAEALAQSGIDLRERLLISKKAHLILPTHRLLDAAYEARKGDAKIGTTGKGIGPTYTDKVSRNGLRVGDVLLDFQAKYAKAKQHHVQLLQDMGMLTDFSDLEQRWLEAIDYLRQYQLIDSEYYINKALDEQKKVLAEGAQGSLLDLDFGSYPFVTSSNTISAGCCTGLGVAPLRIGRVFGIFKAYCTRVGAGPFPTELHDEIGEEIGRRGAEFGAVTGRKRRCGWLDLVALKYTVMLNGVTDLIMMKSDVLSNLDEIKVCTHYELNGELTQQVPYEMTPEVKPIYKTFEGWHEDMTHYTQESDFSANFISYVTFIEEYLGVPVRILSVGPDRAQTIVRKGWNMNS